LGTTGRGPCPGPVIDQASWLRWAAAAVKLNKRRLMDRCRGADTVLLNALRAPWVARCTSAGDGSGQLWPTPEAAPKFICRPDGPAH
jgi:hypothetical protein